MPILLHAVMGVEAVLVVQGGGDLPRQGGANGAIFRQLLTDIGRLGGEDGKAGGAVDLDLEHPRAFQLAHKALAQGIDLAVATQMFARHQAVVGEQADNTLVLGVAQRMGQRLVFVLTHPDNLLHRKVAVEDTQGEGGQQDGDKAGDGEVAKQRKHGRSL